MSDRRLGIRISALRPNTARGLHLCFHTAGHRVQQNENEDLMKLLAEFAGRLELPYLTKDGVAMDNK